MNLSECYHTVLSVSLTRVIHLYDRRKNLTQVFTFFDGEDISQKESIISANFYCVNIFFNSSLLRYSVRNLKNQLIQYSFN